MLKYILNNYHPLKKKNDKNIKVQLYSKQKIMVVLINFGSINEK